MPDYIRVKQKDTGHEVSILQSMYDFAPDAYMVLDKPATNAGGDVLPPKFKTTVTDEAAAKKKAGSGQKARSEEDN